MAKHVFRKAGTGYVFWHEGVFQRETDTRVYYKTSYGVRFMGKGKAHVIECDNPDAVSAAYADEYKRHIEAVSAAKKHLDDVISTQIKSALKAANNAS